jgi:hypothetical protein
MDKLVDFLKKNIQKNKLKGCGWSYTVDLRNSCISSEQYHLFNAVFSGEGNIEDLVKVHVNYYIHDIHCIQTRFKILRGLQKAIEYVWFFPEMYLLCLDCCQLIKRDQECEECIFYKTKEYDYIYKQKDNPLCLNMLGVLDKEKQIEYNKAYDREYSRRYYNIHKSSILEKRKSYYSKCKNLV